MEEEYLIKYICYECKHEWHEVYSCACDSECPECDARAVTATSFVLLDKNSIDCLEKQEA